MAVRARGLFRGATMDAEHRVDGQDGTAGAGPEGGSQASSGQDGGQGGAVSAEPHALGGTSEPQGEHKREDASPQSGGEHREEGTPPAEGSEPRADGKPSEQGAAQRAEDTPSEQGGPQDAGSAQGQGGEPPVARGDTQGEGARPHNAAGEAPGSADASGSEGSKDQAGSQEGGLQAEGTTSDGQAEPPAKDASHAQGEHQAVSESHGQNGSESGGGSVASAEARAEQAPSDGEARVTSALDERPQGAFWTGETDGDKASDSDDESREDVLPEPEQRLSGRVTTVLLPLEKLQDESAFKLRPEDDVSGLATDIARLGQLFPVDVRPAGEDRYQLVCGFRRVAALRFLKRDAVQARIHLRLSDEDALVMSLAEAIHATPVGPEVLEAKRDELEAQGRLSAAVRDMLEKALATEDTLAPEGVEEEIDADELAQEVAQRLGAINQDLSLLADVFAALDESRKAELLMQLRYSSELVTYLEGL
ncbi:ParB N-terminal domain-containing protein [Myxococcus xanthus]|uniref:ParB N-terminal domain-containing protein n=2 Tax=Myxococcus xanthus TaxID=34 RepID=A0A7Y4IE76_MYXXA|nr:ParB N-terminal domain-containing protein [Myxococcus xanthus]NOJ87705.1 ParB N-terminal domain-containing protein [Myxococcus xanthus]